MYVINWIKKPYFFINSPKYNLLLCFGVGLFIFLFLFLFQPFGITSLENNKLLYTGGFGIVTFTIQVFFFLIFPFIFKKNFNDEKWTVGKNIFFLFLLVLCITIGNWYYNSIVQSTESLGIISLKYFFLYTFTIAIFPVTIFTFISEKLYRNFREKNANEIMKFKVSSHFEKGKKEIKIVGDNKKEELSFNTENLIYITSQGNYASFFIRTPNGIEEKIIRNTLTNITLELKEYSNFVRCHKSYIVNCKFMNSISGNARGYFLESELFSIQIPISRSYKKEELKNLIC